MRKFYLTLVGIILICVFTNSGYCQGGNDCTVANIPANHITLPYQSFVVETTCGAGNDYDSSNASSCGGKPGYMSGEDKLYVFIAPYSGSILLSFSSIADTTSGIFIYDGCPDTADCVGSNTEYSPIKFLGFNVDEGKTYFVMIDHDTTAAGCVPAYELNIGLPNAFCPSILNISHNYAPNADLEYGNFTGWEAFTGTCCEIAMNSTGFVADRHTITSGPGTDPRTGDVVKVVAPGGGKYSARLGNWQIGAQAERLKYKFKVNPYTNGIIYKYAVILQDPGHNPPDQPRFEIRVLDTDENVVPCGYYKVVAAPDIPCFIPYPGAGTVYQDWTTIGIDLNPYMDDSVTIEFSTGDCRLTGHYGYAYIDVACINLQIVVSEGDFCRGDTILTLKAPDGFSSYLWSTGDSTQTIEVHAPYDDTLYTVVLTPVQGFNCASTLEMTFPANAFINGDFSAPDVCLGDTAFFTDLTDVISTNITSWKWFFGDGDSSVAQNPYHLYTAPGTYTVTLLLNTNLGCKDTVIKTIRVMEPLEAPVPFCLKQTMTSIEIAWNRVQGCTGYQVSVDSGSWILPSSGSGPNDTTHIVTGLIPEQVLSFTVRALGPAPCGNQQSVDTITCYAVECDTMGLWLSADTTIIRGDSALISLLLNGGVPPFTYTWTPPVGTGAGPYYVSPDSTTTYYVTITDSLSPFCPPVNDSVTITVLCRLFTAGLNIDNTVITRGDSAQVWVNLSGGIGPFSYTWTPDIGNGPGPYTVKPDSNMTYYVTVMDLGSPGCPVFRDSVSIQVLCNEFDAFASNDTVIYRGDSAWVMVNVSGGTGPFSYSWTPDIGNGPGPYSVNPDSTTVYHVTIIDSGATDCPFYLDSITVTVLCQQFTTSIVNDTVIYRGDYAMVGVNVSGGTGPFSYTWNPDIGNGPGPYTVNPESTTVYYITIIDSGAMDCPLYTDSVLVNVVCRPSFITISGDSVLLLGDSMQISVQVSGGTGLFTYTWVPDIGNGPGPYTVSPSDTITYYVTVRDSGDLACPLYTDSFHVNVHQCFSPASLELTGDTVLSPGETTEVMAHAYGGEGPFDYLWTPRIGIGPGPFTINPDTLQSLRVSVSDLGSPGCPPLEDSLSFRVDSGPADQTCAFFMPTAFSPNGDGMNDILFGYTRGLCGEFYLKIFNRWGEQIYYTEDPKVQWNGHKNNDKSKLISPPGAYVYVLKLRNEEGKLKPRFGLLIIDR